VAEQPRAGQTRARSSSAMTKHEPQLEKTVRLEKPVRPAHRPTGIAPHLVDPSGTVGASWTEPPGAFLQFMRPARGTAELAEWLTGPCLDQLRERFPGVRDLVLVFDMRSMLGRSATARALLLQASTGCVGLVRRVVLLPSPHMGPAYIQIVEATAAMLRVAGFDMYLAHDLEPALHKHGVRIESLSGVRPAVRV